MRRVLLLLLCLALGCRRGEAARVRPAAAGESAPRVVTALGAIPAVDRSASQEPVTLVTDRAALAIIAQRAGDLGQLVFASAAALDNARLYAEPSYRALVDIIASDVHAVATRDPLAGVGIRGHAHRLFDIRWLRASSARFELIAVSNRIDRHFYNPEGCGEVRLLYRLAYSQRDGATTQASRLPMTLGIELRADPAGQPGACVEAARRWLVPEGLTGEALGRRLSSPSGPLAPAQLTRARIVQLVSNVQTVRWPSAVKPDLGGHAEYALRAFAWDPTRARYLPRKLENTPDVARLQREPALRAMLHAFVSSPENLRAIDGGNVRLPDALLAESVVSVTPRGLSRRTNRPFRSLLEPSALSALELSTLRFARTPEALVRRLDDLSCSGCHQSRSIAGFHVLGDDALETPASNALALGTSPHARLEQPRRAAYVRALARGEQPDQARPLAERAALDDDGYGAHCGLGDPGFSEWTCARGLHCDDYEAAIGESTVGACLPDRVQTGDPCEPARVRPAADARREGVSPAEERACPEVCERTRVGFPAGMCAGSCASLGAEAACGGIALLTPFNDCLARARPFAECARDFVRPAGLRACGEGDPCRDDYVCARGAANRGVCLPPYFVFQLRVDGHPSPR